jgi:hypothetical protein
VRIITLKNNKNNSLWNKKRVVKRYKGLLSGGEYPQTTRFIDDCRVDEGKILDFIGFLPVNKWVLIGGYCSETGGNPQTDANRGCTETAIHRNAKGFPVHWDYDCLPDRPGNQQSPRLSISGGWRGGEGEALPAERGTPNYSIFPYLSPAHF